MENCTVRKHSLQTGAKAAAKDKILLREFLTGKILVNMAEHEVNLCDKLVAAGDCAAGACRL